MPQEVPVSVLVAYERPLGTSVCTCTLRAPAPIRASSIVIAPAPGGTEQSNQQLKIMFQFRALVPVTVKASSVAVCDTVQSFSGLASLSRKPVFCTTAPGASGTRNDATPRLLCTSCTAYS